MATATTTQRERERERHTVVVSEEQKREVGISRLSGELTVLDCFAEIHCWTFVVSTQLGCSGAEAK